MINIDKKENCCGCTSCVNICPMNAIDMIADEEGFLYPKVNSEVCVKCGLCLSHCPIKNRNENSEQVSSSQTGYIVRIKDESILRNSTSGGVFTALASYFINSGGVVYGTGYDENMKVICKRAESISDIEEMRGSKFVQSDLKNTFRDIKSQLSKGISVLFSGTPCQVDGLIAYLHSKPSNLFCVDFVCRGVPSPMLWESYIRYMEDKFKSKVVYARFKNKTYGYHTSTMKVDFENKKTWYGSGRVDPMMKAFVKELASRPSCGACSFKGKNRSSDITMFDCYEFTQITGVKDDNKGYSSIFVNSEAGRYIFEKIRPSMNIYEADVEELITHNGIMVCNSAKPNDKRELFYKVVAERGINEAIKEVSPITAKDRLIERTKAFFYRTGLIVVVKRLKKETVRVD